MKFSLKVGRNTFLLAVASLLISGSVSATPLESLNTFYQASIDEDLDAYISIQDEYFLDAQESDTRAYFEASFNEVDFLNYQIVDPRVFEEGDSALIFYGLKGEFEIDGTRDAVDNDMVAFLWIYDDWKVRWTITRTLYEQKIAIGLIMDMAVEEMLDELNPQSLQDNLIEQGFEIEIAEDEGLAESPAVEPSSSVTESSVAVPDDADDYEADDKQPDFVEEDAGVINDQKPVVSNQGSAPASPTPESLEKGTLLGAPESSRVILKYDFETGDISGWTKTGTAFDYQPTYGDNPTERHRGQPSSHQGNYWIGGYEKYQGRTDEKPGTTQGDGPTGTLSSPEFIIPSGTLSFLVGGGKSDQTRVELVVAGNAVLIASGRNTETMHQVEWDIQKWASQSGIIRIIDAASGGWGHVNADNFVLTESPDMAESRGDYQTNDSPKDVALVALNTGITAGVHSTSGQPIFKLEQTSYSPDQTIQLTIQLESLPKSRDWVGLIPAEIPHGDVQLNDKNDLEYHRPKKELSSSLEFTAPLKPGQYSFRYNDTEKKKEVASIGFNVEAPPPSISLAKTSYAPDEEISGSFTAWKWFGRTSWIGIVPSEIERGNVVLNDKHDFDYSILDHATEGEFSFKAPLKPGSYDLRMNQVGPIKEEVASISFSVVAPPPSISLPKKTYAPEEEIKVSFTAWKWFGRTSWIGIVPSEIKQGEVALNDKHDLDYSILDHATEGVVSFKAPLKPGEYDLRMNQVGPIKEEVASISFRVEAPPPSISLPKTAYTPGEEIKVSFTAWKWFGRTSWIGIVPSEIERGDVALNDKHDIAYKILDHATEGEFSLKTPLETGKYDLRMNQVGPIKEEVASTSFEVLDK